MNSTIQELLRRLPAVHRIIDEPSVITVMQNYNMSREHAVHEIGLILSTLREIIISGELPEIDEREVINRVVVGLKEKQQPHLQKVINGTGIILHTNLGRALLSEAAIHQMNEILYSYSNLEYNLREGIRGSRHDHVEDLIKRLTGAEAAMVVNNNAASVFLVLREIAKNRQVIVSRGELVEIGGSFRISEIMTESGAHLVEVGTTNKTKLSDYERHITSETSLLLKVHTSNFRVVGFTEAVEIKELVSLGQRYDLPVFEDLGSGVLYDLRFHGIGDEPTVMEVLASGVDLVSFSGDKLLGGPQAGIIAGKEKWIKRLKKNQLSRILRVDKGTLAALEATLRLYLNPEKATAEIPTLRDLLLEQDRIKERAEAFLQKLIERELLTDCQIEILSDVSEVGGGTLPMLTLPTWVVALSHPRLRAHHLEQTLRLSRPAVISRISRERVILDFRTIQEKEIEALLDVFAHIKMTLCSK